MIYALLPNKQQKTYLELFVFIFNLIDNCPQSVMCDFEKAIHNALIEAAQNKFDLMISIQGCYFHLVGNLWKHVQHFRLVEKYSVCKEFRKLYKLTKALAFLPPKHVVHSFKQIQAICNTDFKPILEYFEEYYIGIIDKKFNKK